MEWVLWLFIALVAAPIVLMSISPAVKAGTENARRSYAAKIEAERHAEQRRAAAEKAAAERVIAEQKKAAAAARKAEQEQRKAEREAELRRKRAERLAAARELAELRKRALQAEKELRALQSGRQSPAPEKPAADPAPVKDPADNARQSFPQTFTGEVVAFTGTLPTMTRKEAIRATNDRGGRAYESINTHCTLLVVGERPGNNQLERADNWAIKKITWEQWFERAEISWRRRKIAQSMMKESRAA